jgi:uncharacterized protein
MKSPFHRGEKEAQTRAGVRAMAEQLGRNMVRDHMTDQHREFFGQLPLLFVGSLDESGRPWASPLVGRPGFARSPDPRRLVVQATPLPHDPLASNLKDGAQLGILGLEFTTRRRNRLNGEITRTGEGLFEMTVGQSFGNCPQYIQKRSLGWREDTTSELSQGRSLSPEATHLIQQADTFFIASSFEQQGVDMSHRGGKPGFVKVESEDMLVFPDFSGNNLLNTIGNLVANPRAGLLFLDYESGDILHLTAGAEIVWDGPDVESFPGARRLVRLHVLEWRLVRNSLPFSWELQEYSPSLEGTGTWREPTWREYVISQIRAESRSIKSFYLSPVRGEAPAFLAGQHLPVRIPVGDGESVIRNYSLSRTPGHSELRITVKREEGGRGSEALHKAFAVGDRLLARAPGGDFVLDTENSRPVALVSAGVGITPVLSMWQQMARHQSVREVYFVHGARNGAEHVLREEVEASAGGRRSTHFRYSRPLAGDRFDSTGHVDVDLLQSILPVHECDLYLCGPTSFLESLYKGLRKLGVTKERIHFETFGASLVTEQQEQRSVEFRRSQKSSLWNGGTLLELAEDAGIRPPFSCRSGACGACSVRLLSGKVEYIRQPSFPVSQGEALLCSAKPLSDDVVLEL